MPRLVRCLRAGLGDVARARHCAFRTTACGGGAGGTPISLPAADVAARAPAPASGGSRCHAPAATAPPTPVAAHRQLPPSRPHRWRACHAPRAELRRTGAPVAIRGRIPSASKVSEASMMTSAWSSDGSSGWTWN